MKQGIQIIIRFGMRSHKWSSEGKSYYKLLGVNSNATANEIKHKYYLLAKKYHPDHNKGTQNRFKAISEAYNVLSNPESRKQYDNMQLQQTYEQYQKQSWQPRKQNRRYRYQMHSYRSLRPSFTGLIIKLFFFSFIVSAIIELMFPSKRNQQIYIRNHQPYQNPSLNSNKVY